MSPTDHVAHMVWYWVGDEVRRVEHSAEATPLYRQVGTTLEGRFTHLGHQLDDKIDEEMSR